MKNRNPFIDDECSESEGENCNTPGKSSFEDDDDELTEADKAFICDDEDDIIPDKVIEDDEFPSDLNNSKQKEIITLAQDVIDPVKFDEEDDLPKTPIKKKVIDDDDAVVDKTKAPKKVIKLLGDDIVKEAFSKGKNAPDISRKTNKRQSNVTSKESDNEKDLKQLIDDVNEKSNFYQKNRTKLIVKFASYLQRYKQ